jgi:hypothetical protein
MRIKRPEVVLGRMNQPHKSWCVVPKTTPVPFFGNVETAKSLTIGINPSFNEFLSNNGKLLSGTEKRLEDHETLGIIESEYYEQVGFENAEKIYDSCINYFSNNPYNWFEKMEKTINSAFNTSFYNSSAAHVDLVQWATDPVWSLVEKKDPTIARHLIEIEKPLLLEHLLWLQKNNLELSVIFLSGRTVISNLTEEFNLKSSGMTKVKGKNRQNELFTGVFQDVKVFGTTMNVSDSYTSNAHRMYLNQWLRDRITSS